MPHRRISLRSLHGLTAATLALAGSLSLASAQTPLVDTREHRSASAQQDLYLGNILGGVVLYSTGKNEHQVGDINDALPRVTGVWVDRTGVLYAFTDNPRYPYETIEEFRPGAVSPFFSLVLQRYGTFVAADSKQNVYAQGANGQGRQVIDVYPPGTQNFTHEYVVPLIARNSGPQGMAFDASGTLLVGVAALTGNRQGQFGAVFRLDTRTSTFVNLNLRQAVGGLIATDGAGNLYVGGGRSISVYARGATNPSRIVHANDTIVALTTASDGTLYISTYRGGITVYAPGQSRPQSSFTPQAQVSGLALGPG